MMNRGFLSPAIDSFPLGGSPGESAAPPGGHPRARRVISPFLQHELSVVE